MESSQYVRSTLSASTRRQVLWNVLQPGDPYDIKRSMIAKLPGDKKIFMGDHLELVCMLQAAQIERLCQFLEDYKLKYREIQRSNLDRHSYEVQIKQLTLRLIEEESVRGQNLKLKEFIRKQGLEIESIQKSSRENRQQFDENFKGMYEKSLQRINQLLVQNSELKNVGQGYLVQIQNFNARYQALERAKNRQIEELKISNTQAINYERQLGNIRAQYDSEIRRLEYEVRRVKQILESKNTEITQLLRRNELQEQQLASLRVGGEKIFLLERHIVEYENRFVILGQQVQRLNIALRDCTLKLEDAESKKRDLERKVEKYEFDIREWEARWRSASSEAVHLQQLVRKYDEEVKRLGEGQQYKATFEAKIIELTQENERLAARLKGEAEGSKRLREDLERLSYENSRVKLVERQNTELRQAVAENNVLKRRIAELENKLSIINKEVDRVNIGIKNREAELDKLRNLSYQHQFLKSKLKETETQFSSRFQYEISRLKAEHDIQLLNLNKSKGSQFQSKSQLYEKQLDRLKDYLKNKTQESERQRIRINELEGHLNRLDIEYTAKFKNYESNFNLLKKQNEELYGKVKFVGQLERKNYQLQSKVGQLAREAERLNGLVRTKQGQIQQWRGKIRELQVTVTQRYQLETSRRTTQYEQTVGGFKKQNEELRSKLTQIVNESNRKLGEASTEIDRINLALKSRTDENRELDIRAKQSAQQIEILRRTIKQYESHITNKLEVEVKNKYAIYEQNIQQLSQQNEQLRRRLAQNEAKLGSVTIEFQGNLRNLGQQNEGLRRQIADSKISVSNYQLDVSRKVTTFEQNILILGRQKEDLRRKIGELQSKFALVSQELERVNQKLNGKQNELVSLQARLKAQNQQYQNLTKYIKEYELSVKSKFQGQVTRKYTTYQQNIQNLVRQNEDLRKRTAEYEQRIAKFSQQFDRLTSSYKNLSQQNDNLKKQHIQKDSSISSYEIEVNKRITVYETNVINLTRINQQLQRKLQEVDQSGRQNIGELQRKLVDLDGRLGQLTQEKQRLIQLLKNKTDDANKLEANIRGLSQENEGWRRKYQQLQLMTGQKLEVQVKRNYAVYQQNIAKISQQNEDLRRRLQQLGDLNRRLGEYEIKLKQLSAQYEKVVGKFTNTGQQNDALRKKIANLEVSIGNYEGEVNRRITIYQQKIASFNKENDQLRRKLQETGDLSKRIAEYESRLAVISQQLQRVTSNLKLQAQENEALRRQLNDNKVSVSNYQLQVSRKVTTYEQNLNGITKENQDLRRKVKDYENRLVGLSQESERANNSLRLKTEESARYEISLKGLAQQNQQLRKQIRDLQLSITNKYQLQVNKKLSIYQQNITVLTRDGDQLRRKIQESELKLGNASQQIERLNQALRARGEQIKNWQNKHRSLNQDFENSKRQYGELQLSVKNKFEYEVTRKYGVYQQNIQELTKRISEIQNRYKESINEIERLNNLLRLKVQESSAFVNNLKQVSNQNEQLKRRWKDYENNASQGLTGLRKQNDDLKRRVQELETGYSKFGQESERKLVENETKFKIMSQEIDRLNQASKAKAEEFNLLDVNYKKLGVQLQNTRKQYRDLEYSTSQKLQLEVKNKYLSYQNNVAALTKENDQLRKRLQEIPDLNRKNIEYENKFLILSQQIQRINSLLKGKSDDSSKLEINYKNLGIQYENLKRRSGVLQQNIAQYSKQNEQLRQKWQESGEVMRRIPEYQQKMGILLQENEKYQLALRSKTEQLNNADIRLRQGVQDVESLKRQIRELELNLTNKYELQVSRKVTTYEQNIGGLTRQNQDLKRKRLQLQNKIAILNQQIERLNFALKSKNQELQKASVEIENWRRQTQQKIQSSQSQYNNLQSSYSLVTKQYENAKKHLLQYQQSIKKLYSQFERLQGIINQLKKQRQTLYQKNRALSDQINRLSRENKDLEQQTKDIRLRLSDETALQKRITQHMSLMVVLFAEIESLRRRVKDKEKEVEQVRRSSLAPNIL